MFACLAVIILIIVAACIDTQLFDQQNPVLSAGANTGANGLWLRYFWYAGKHKEQKDWDDMLARLRDNQIKYAYFHVLTTKSDGKLKIHRLAEARKIVNAVHAGSPKTQVVAWVYVGALPQADGLDLSKSEVRKTLVEECLWLVNDCGFDGIQWDYEFSPNGDRSLLTLLDETRAVLRPEQLLSVATPMWYPGTLWGWNDDYFREVARRCDQICVMCYDSYLYLPRAYAWLLSEQVIHVSAAVGSANDERNAEKASRLFAPCSVIYGLPTYEDVTLAHRAQTESLANSLRGINSGLHATSTRRDVIEGIALFADYTTDEAEWNTYRNGWLNSGTAPARDSR